MSTTTANNEAESPKLTIYTGADAFGCNLKDSLVSHLRSLPNIDLVDLGVDSYYTIASNIGRRVSTSPDPSSARGLLACGTGVGVSIFANKHPGVYAATCSSVADAVNTRSINNCNVLSVSGMYTPPEDALKILDAWVSTPFRSPCPASDGKPWSEETDKFLENSISEMKSIPFDSKRAISCLRKGIQFEPIRAMPGLEMKIVRESPTSAIARFKAGGVEPAHHHTFGFDLVVTKGKKKVWNLDKKESYELGEGDFLFMPAGDVHRAKYFEDTEFFIRWDGDWDILLDEDLETAKGAIEKELGA